MRMKAFTEVIHKETGNKSPYARTHHVRMHNTRTHKKKDKSTTSMLRSHTNIFAIRRTKQKNV